MTSDLKAKFELGLQLQQQSRLAEAQRIYEEVAAADPKHFLARYNLGVVLYSLGRMEDAERCFAESSAIHPELAQSALAHGKVLQDLGRLEGAVACYDRFVALKADNPNAWCDRGTALLNLGRLAEALESFEKTLQLAPQHYIAHYNRASALLGLKRIPEALESVKALTALKPDFLEAIMLQGNILRLLDRQEEALRCYEAVLAVNAKLPDVINNKGAALLDMGRLAESLACFEQALALQPENIAAMVNLGRVYGKLGRTDEEIEIYNRVLAGKPDFPEALAGRANALLGKRRFAEAVDDLKKALALKPDYAQAAHVLGNVYAAQGQRVEALEVFERALVFKPDYPEALNNRGLILRALNRHPEAIGAFEHLLKIKPDYPYAAGSLFAARMHACEWAGYHEAAAALIAGVRAGKSTDNPFSFLAYAQEPADQLACAQLYAREKHKAVPLPPFGPRAVHSKIRIAYISADLHNHATSYLIAGLIEEHDRSRFDVLGFSLSSGDGSSISSRVRGGFDSLTDISAFGDGDAAQHMRNLGVDIAVDLKGYTKDARPVLFVTRAAPVQVNFLGYPGTFGHECMDYIIADKIVLPPEHQPFFSEKAVYLPDCYQPNDSRRTIDPATPTRAEAGLPETGFVFCSFNGTYKITPEVFDIWMRLLKAVPGSVLWLFKSNSAVDANLRREATARGVDPGRLVFAPVLQSEKHLARHRLADLFLDTLPVNAHTTASDSLWAGLPLVTCLGRSFIGRVAASVLTAGGVPELITTSLPEYEALALKLATNPALLAGLKAKVAAQRNVSPLFDTARFCKHIEAAYATMHERRMRGEPPASFAVPPAAGA